MQKLCVPAFSLGMARRAEEAGADIIELRLDSFPEEDLAHFLAGEFRASVPLVATCRPAWELGKFMKDEEERKNILMRSVFVADYVDVELASGGEFVTDVAKVAHDAGTKIIVSEHFSRMPLIGELEKSLMRQKGAGADICKIVPTAMKPSDNERVFELLSIAKRKRIRLVSIAMGSDGMLSRILSPFFGSEFTFAALEAGLESAPGQLSMESMRDFYESVREARKIDARTRFAFVIGDPVAHSLSPAMMNSAFRKIGMNAVYGKLHLTSHQLGAFFPNLREERVLGANITIPHKSAAISLSDRRSEAAKKIGAANAIVNENGKLAANNTDCIGAVSALKEKCPVLAGKRCLIIGAGGSSRAISYGLKAEGTDICIINRTVEHARDVAQSVGASYCKLDSRNLEKELLKSDIVINTTSVGMGTKETPVKKFPSAKKRKLTVMDIVYTPRVTEMLKRAERAGHSIVTGEHMLLYQGTAAFELFTKKKAPVSSMRQALLAKLK